MLDEFTIKVLIVSDPDVTSGTHQDALEMLLSELAQLGVTVRQSTSG